MGYTTSLAIVPDAIERSDQIVRDQQRTIGQLRHIDRTAEVIAIVVPAFGERLRFSGDMAVILEERHHQPGADRRGSIPRAMLRGKNSALIFLRKHVAGVEDQTEVRGMCGLLHFGENRTSGRRIVLVLLGAGLAATIPGETEILTAA